MSTPNTTSHGTNAVKQDPNQPTHTDRQGPADLGPISAKETAEREPQRENPAVRKAPGQNGVEAHLTSAGSAGDDPVDGPVVAGGNQSQVGSIPTHQHEEMGHGR